MSDGDVAAQVRETIDAWATAERTGDTGALGALLTEEFAGIGPHGFQLDKGQWLDRYDSGALVNEEFAATDVAVRSYGDAAIANGVQIQEAAYRGNPASGRFRLTVVLVRRSDGWPIANIQLSFMPEQ